MTLVKESVENDIKKVDRVELATEIAADLNFNLSIMK